MKANPGGQLAAHEVLGRDDLIARIWRSLERQSVVLGGERRMGKTSVIVKMRSSPPKGKLLLYRDLEGLRTPLEFVQRVFRDTESYLSARRKSAERVRELLRHLQGAEVAKVFRFPDSVARHWKALLSATIEDLVTHQDNDVILLWDELPLMLFNVKETEGEATAMELLDALRELRQNHPALRMVFTGSVGLHNVIASLKRSGYANDPTNDMDMIDVPPLDHAEARKLAIRLLEGEGLVGDDREELADIIAESVDCVPFFIHHVVDQLVLTHTADVDQVDQIVSNALLDADDRWHLMHYRERMGTYYESDELPLALGLLDALCTTDAPSSFPELYDLLKAQMETDDREGVLSVLGLLQRDHYLSRDSAGRFQFSLGLIRRFWRHHRGLEG